MTPAETLRSAAALMREPGQRIVSAPESPAGKMRSAARLLREDRTGDRLRPALRAALAAWLGSAAQAWDEGTEWDEALDVARACLEDPGGILSAPVSGLWPIGASGIAVQARNSLYRGGYATVAGVTACTARDLLDIRGFGCGQLTEVRRVLADAGLALRGERAAS